GSIRRSAGKRKLGLAPQIKKIRGPHGASDRHHPQLRHAWRTGAAARRRKRPTVGSGARSSPIVPPDFGTKDDALSATACTLTHDPPHPGFLANVTVITTPCHPPPPPFTP